MHEGRAKSISCHKLVTDVFNMTMVLTKRRVGTPFDDAVLAGKAVGAFKNCAMFKDWVEQMAR